jgi:hypothetical protein
MQMLHFSDNTCADQSNKLYKLGTLFADVMLNSNYFMQPNEDMCINESLVKFMVNLPIYKNKKDRFGIKEFKLYIFPCYTIAIKIYYVYFINI